MKSRGLNIPCIETVEDVLSHSYGVHPAPKVTAPVLPAVVTIGKDVSVESVHLEQDVSVEPVEPSISTDPFEEPEPKSTPLVKSTELESPSKSKRTRKR